MGINKVVYNGGTLIDLTGDTVTADKLMQGYIAHDRTGTVIIGTATGGGDGYVWQDAQGYVHLSDEQGTQTVVEPLSVTQNGTYTAQTGHAYSPVTVNVSGGSLGIPIFTAQYDNYGLIASSISCDRTFQQCNTLVDNDNVFAGVLTQTSTIDGVVSTHALEGSKEYFDGGWGIIYYNSGNYEQSIGYKSNGTFVIVDPNNL